MDFLHLLHAILMGFLEGLTEFLPVSSTAHLILASQVLGFERSETFKVVIQLGAILALVVLYFQKIWTTTVTLPTSAASRRFALSVIVAFIPAVFAGVLLEETISAIFLADIISPAAAQIIAGALIIGGVIMLLVERFRPAPAHHEADALPLWKSFAVGCCQALALIPGVSRSGATIVGALALGVERRAAAEFSFYLSIPTMLGATAYKLYKDWDQLQWNDGVAIGLGFVAAFIAAMLVAKAFLALVSRYGFAPFAFYRIGLGVVVLIAAALGVFGP
jgi:undecaprenyl-diphosphatase